jgi:putative membrane protein
MKSTLIVERFSLVFHIAAMLFGLAGLLLVLPHPAFILSLPAAGQQLFQWSMAGGGVVYIVLGALAVALHGIRTLGWQKLLAFLLPSLLISLSSELLGTSTGFPFGHYGYLSGLGYKIAGLVPFTIPLSWFYMGLSCYLLATACFAPLGNRLLGSGQKAAKNSPASLWGALLVGLLTIGLGAVLLTAWDLVLDPAMSQAPVPFWEFQEVGAFFGMPYRNLLGWTGTGAIFMGVAALLWRGQPNPVLTRAQLRLPLLVYLVNFGFGATITLTTLDHQFLIPASLGVLFGVVPALLSWWLAPKQAGVSAVEVPPTTLPRPATALPLEAASK